MAAAWLKRGEVRQLQGLDLLFVFVGFFRILQIHFTSQNVTLAELVTLDVNEYTNV